MAPDVIFLFYLSACACLIGKGALLCCWPKLYLAFAENWSYAQLQEADPEVIASERQFGVKLVLLGVGMVLFLFVPIFPDF